MYLKQTVLTTWEWKYYVLKLCTGILNILTFIKILLVEIIFDLNIFDSLVSNYNSVS